MKYQIIDIRTNEVYKSYSESELESSGYKTIDDKNKYIDDMFTKFKNANCFMIKFLKLQILETA